MKSLCITNASVVMNDAVYEGFTLCCRDGVIHEITAPGKSHTCSSEHTVDAHGNYLLPGFIDMHIHGTFNKMVDTGKEELQELCRILPRYGVTGFLPTVTPMKDPIDDPRLLKELASVRPEGTEILGFFLEGHFLALTGAIANIPHEHSRKRVDSLLDAASPYHCVFGISPEVPGIDELLPYMTETYPAFITHTKASVEQTRDAILAGARHATHFYDVFPYPGDQEGGVRGCGAVEAIMADPSVTVDFILDGEHVHPAAVEMALTCKGPKKVSLITDANINAGLPPGRYTGIGGRDITVAYEGAPARMVESYHEGQKPGGLAGSGLTMDLALRNAVRFLGIGLPLASAMVSGNPARVLGVNNRKGNIAVGYDADLVLLDPNLQVLSCWVSGNQVFSQ